MAHETKNQIITPASRAFLHWMLYEAPVTDKEKLAKKFLTHGKDLMTYHDYAREKHPKIFARFMVWRAKQRLL